MTLLAILFAANVACAGWNGWIISTGHGNAFTAITLALNIGAAILSLAVMVRQ